MGHDFYGVEISGSIRTFTKQGGDFQEYELWVDPTPLEVSGAEDYMAVLRSLAFVQEVTINIGMGMNSKVSVLLAPPFEEGIALINSRLIQYGVGQLQIQVGYSTGSKGARKHSAIFGGLMQKPDVKISTDVSVTINALGIGYALNLTGSHDPGHFKPGTTPAEAVLAILKHYTREGADATGINLEGIYADFDQKARTGGHPFFRPIVSVVPAPKTATSSATTETAAAPSYESRTVGKKAKYKETKGKNKKGDDLKVEQAARAAEIDAARKAQEADALNRTAADKAALLIGVDENGEKLKEGQGAVAFAPESYVDPGTTPIPGGQIYYLSIEQGPRNDWWFVYEMCKNYGLELQIIDRNVRVRDADKWKKSGPVMEFALRGTIDTDADIPRYPIIDLSSPTTAMWIAPGMGMQIMEDLKDSGETNKVIIDDVTTGITREGDTALDPNADSPYSSKSQDMAANFPGNPETAAFEAGKAEYKSINNGRGIVVEVTSIGIPELEPGMVVKLTGAGTIFPDTFGVLEVEHKVGTGGFTTRWKGLSSSIPPELMLQTKPAAGPQTPSPDTSGSKSFQSTTIRPFFTEE